MTISVVNGYVCTSSCDVAKAKKGEDPHPALHAAKDESPNDASGTSRGPAVLFGGSLGNGPGAEGINTVGATANADPASGQSRKPMVDLLV